MSVRLPVSEADAALKSAMTATRLPSGDSFASTTSVLSSSAITMPVGGVGVATVARARPARPSLSVSST
ncbi:MAG: hypothetical protein QOG34_2161 [Frankiaceae bacterium]|nr:hypothetical protein [Frankiaceae bacterium]